MESRCRITTMLFLAGAMIPTGFERAHCADGAGAPAEKRTAMLPVVENAGICSIRKNAMVDLNLGCCSFLHEVASTALVRQKWIPGESWSNYGCGISTSSGGIRQMQGFLNRYTWGCVGLLPYWKNFG